MKIKLISKRLFKIEEGLKFKVFDTVSNKFASHNTIFIISDIRNERFKVNYIRKNNEHSHSYYTIEQGYEYFDIGRWVIYNHNNK